MGGADTDWVAVQLGQCKARPFNFHQVCLFLSLFLYFFVSLFLCYSGSERFKTSKKKKRQSVQT